MPNNNRKIDYNDVEKYVIHFWRSYHTSPSIRDVQESCGISSTSVTNYVLNSLAEEGKIIYRHEGTARQIIPASVDQHLNSLFETLPVSHGVRIAED